jgi:hypothetical protein
MRSGIGQTSSETEYPDRRHRHEGPNAGLIVEQHQAVILMRGTTSATRLWFVRTIHDGSRDPGVRCWRVLARYAVR